jgi:hypothetical protein
MNEDTAKDTLLISCSTDFAEELSLFLDVLSSSARLRILKFIEVQPRDARAISHEIQTSYENTKKHLDKLLSIGVIRKEAGIGQPTSKGVHPVWEYSLVPGSMEAIVRSLGIFSNIRIGLENEDLAKRLSEVRSRVATELASVYPAIVVMGGPDDRKFFPLKEDVVLIGRNDRDRSSTGNPAQDIVLSDNYKSVTRITKPHGRITHQGDAWFFEDCGSTGGTTINGGKASPGTKNRLQDGDLLELGKGVSGAKLLVILPLQQGSRECSSHDR